MQRMIPTTITDWRKSSRQFNHQSEKIPRREVLDHTGRNKQKTAAMNSWKIILKRACESENKILSSFI